MRTTREPEVILGSDAPRILALMIEEEEPTPATGDESEAQLPATLTFVLLIGATFFVLWFGVFMLLKERW
jgi:hypothetical protein